MNRPEFTVLRVKANHSTLQFDYHQPPFDNQDVRHAVCYALPYAEIIESVYDGFARQSKGAYSNVSKYYSEEFWRFDPDPAKARELLRQAGYPDGFATELYVKDTVESRRFGDIVQKALRQVGIEAELKSLADRMSADTRMPMWFKEECGHALCEAMYDLGHDYDPPVGLYGALDVRNKRWTDQMRVIRRSPSSEQPGLYRELQRDIVEFAPCAPIAEIQTGWVFRGAIDPWAIDPLCLGVNTTVWSGHRPLYNIPATPPEVLAASQPV
jgi:ABC-type transport system substrate-binding protein